MQASNDTEFNNIERILIHFRNLIEFFFTEKQHSKDLVLAHHYTGEAPRKAPQWAKTYGLRCNELLAHLTYRRTHYRQNLAHHWPDIWKKCMLMNNEIAAFLDSLPPEKRAWFT